MAGNRNPQVEKILSVIEYGTLSVEETRRRVEALIDAETEKEDEPADMELIDACEDLLWELGTHGSIPFDSRMEKNRAAVQARLRPRPARSGRPVVRTAAMVAALFAFALIGESVFHREWLEARSTPDQQQFVLQGYEIDPGIVGRSIAENEGTAPLTTSDWESVVDYLGFEPLIPNPSEEEWNTQLYYISVSSSKINLRARYQQNLDATKTLLYNAQYFLNSKDAYAAYEQNRAGNSIKILGRQAYVSENIDNTSVFFYEKNCTYRVVGNVEYHELLRFAEEMMEGL